MKSNKPVKLRDKAKLDIQDIIDFYLNESEQLVDLFIDDFELAIKYVQLNPKMGSNRYAYELNLPYLKSWLFKKFPYTVFYVERLNHIEIWRILHNKTDIPDWINL